jgi:selenide,water dikinase
VLSDALRGLEHPADPNLLVGFHASDDAAVYRLTPELAVINTVDFITPPVDDPYLFGEIAAANSLSDVYAMGGRPLTALNLVMFPSERLDMGHLREILRGGHDKVREAGASLAGGHSVDDLEPKYGLAVTGVVHPDNILTNAGAKDGDALVLTKPLGTGVLFNAVRAGKLDFPELEVLLSEIVALNDKALEASRTCAVNACTDITGFGIVGHALEMARASGVSVRLHYEQLPVYENARLMYRRRVSTLSNDPNRKVAGESLRIKRTLVREDEELLFDPQTSGGLLLSLPTAEADSLVRSLKGAGVSSASVVGEVYAGGHPVIEII